MSDEIKAHAELLDDGSYHCLLRYENVEQTATGLKVDSFSCPRIEWSEAEIVYHLRVDHHVDEQIVITGTPAPIVHRSALHHRVEGEKCNYHGCLREKAFADAWEQVNKVDSILAALSTIAATKETPGAWRPMMSAVYGEWRARAWSSPDDVDERGGVIAYSQRDATVAATVIQWLGTNVGFCWLEETLRAAGYVVELRSIREARELERPYAQRRPEGAIEPAASSQTPSASS